MTILIENRKFYKFVEPLPLCKVDCVYLDPTMKFRKFDKYFVSGLYYDSKEVKLSTVVSTYSCILKHIIEDDD